MRRDAQADALVDDHAEDGFVFPGDCEYRFDRVAPTALSVLDAAPASTRTLPRDALGDQPLDDIWHVVVVLIDGLGYDVWRQIGPDIPLLDAMGTAGTVTPLLTVYPSETAAAIPTLHTGVSPLAHGVLGWHQYLAPTSRIVQVLPWTTQGNSAVPGSVETPDGWARAVLGTAPLYEQVDITTRVLQPADVAESLSGRGLTRGADERMGWYNATDGAVALRRALTSSGVPSYSLLYIPDVDTIGHRDGPATNGSRAQLEAIGAALERELCHRLDPVIAEHTMTIVTADHGQIDTGGRNVDIREYAPIWDHLETGEAGDPIPPVGSARNLQLFVANGHDTTVRDALERDFDCRALLRPEYEALGLFGSGDPCDQYRHRAPDIVCVHRDRGMWYDDDSLASIGMHGGLTRAEMLVPFVAVRVDDLREQLPP